MVEFLNQYWPVILAAFILLEKVVKLSPTKADDILVDVIFYGLQKLLGKATKRPTP